MNIEEKLDDLIIIFELAIRMSTGLNKEQTDLLLHEIAMLRQKNDD